MTYHAEIHPPVPTLIQSFERIRLMTHALVAVRDIDLRSMRGEVPRGRSRS
jgi:hypothetical protein